MKEITQKEHEITDFEKDIGEVNGTTRWRKGFFHEVAERLYDMGYRKMKKTETKNEIEDIKKDIANLKKTVEKLELKDEVLIDIECDFSDSYCTEIVFMAHYVYNDTLYKTEVCRHIKLEPVIGNIEVVLNKHDFALIQCSNIGYTRSGEREEIKKYRYLSKQYRTVRDVDDTELKYLCKEYKLDILQQGEEK